jgi:hypothetical protein
MQRNLALTALVMVLAITARFSPAGESKPALDTLEKQVAYLEGALAEGLRAKDWKIAEMAVDGLKAAGVTGAALEMSMLRAERQAAMESVQPDLRAQIEMWGVAARAKLGDPLALPALRAAAAEEIAEVKPPDQALWKANPEQAQAAQKAYQAYVAKLPRQDAAVLCLALLKEPKVLERATALLRQRCTLQWYNINPLTLAVVAADPQAGWKALVDTAAATDDTVAWDKRAALLQQLASLASPPPKNGTAEFMLDAELRGQVPKDAAAQVWKSLGALIKNGKNPQQMGNVIWVANTLPGPADAEALDALTELKARNTGPMAQYTNKTIDSILVKNGRAVAPNAPPQAVTPPRPPGEF